jgi:hypothetical protein
LSLDVETSIAVTISHDTELSLGADGALSWGTAAALVSFSMLLAAFVSFSMLLAACGS